jgi:hypothetical protein
MIILTNKGIKSSNGAGSTTTMAATPPSAYPLSKLQARQILEFQDEDNTKIDDELEAIRAQCAEQCRSNTTRCPEHSKEIRRLWRTYYTQPRPGSWASYRPEEYIDEMRSLFDSGGSIKQIHERASQERRMHAKDALCTIRFNDDPSVKQYKKDARSMFDSNVPEQQIRDFILQSQGEVEAKRTPRQQEYDSKLAACEDEQQNFELYKQDACTPLETDSPAMLKLRAKWQALFDGGMPYTEIYATMSKDVDGHQKLERELREKDAELQRAKIAHDKAEFAKAEKKKAIERYARQRMLKRYTFQCAGQNCQNLVVPMSEEVGLLECGICYKLHEDGIFDHRSYFCGEDCMDRTGVSPKRRNISIS